MTFTDIELEAYLDEALPGDEMARIEAAARSSAELSRRLAGIHARRDGGSHSLGDVWRRHRLTCPTRSELGSFLLGVLSKDHAAYIAFHLDEAGCRYCQANRDDLKRQQAEHSEAGQRRRRKYFESSAGYLRRP
ncbi:MAG TPA: hypothetical protein VFI31_06790 [Pirellulales bacterium]|nr:hypothetical protein [Pirellulales bacterium]